MEGDLMATTTRRVIAGLIVLLFATSALQAADMDYAKAVTDAQQAGDMAAVSRLCNKWAAAEPGDERPRIILGQTLLEAGMMDRAVEQFELAVEANPLSPTPRCELGLLFLGQGMPDEALKEFDQALGLQASYLPAVLGSVKARLLRGETDQALVEARKASEFAHESAAAHALVGECCWKLQAYAEAELAFKKALGIDPDDADALFGKARTLEAVGNTDAAQESWRLFLEREPVGVRATHVRNGWVELGLEHLSKACRGFPVWSPDGRRIMYGYGKLGVIELGSGETVGLSAPNGERLFAHDWSPDGKSLVCRRSMPDKRSAVFLYDLGSDGALQLAADNALGEAAMGRFSPDGTKVALSGGSILRGGRRVLVGLAVFDLETGTDMPVPWNNKTRTGRNHGAWCSDSQTLVIHAYGRPNTSDRQLFFLSQDGGTPPLQITDNGAMNVSPCVAPAGRSVAFETNQAGKAGTICLVWSDGASEPVNFARGKAPSWSPDGRRLAYDTPKGIAIARLGGLGRCPVRIATEREGATLVAITTTQEKDVREVRFRWEAFDAESRRLGAPGESAELVELKPGERVEWPIELNAEQAKNAKTIKVTVLDQDGVGAVKLIDWTEEGQ
jgi:tetratricopeptide (TPR) repeat protein